MACEHCSNEVERKLINVIKEFYVSYMEQKLNDVALAAAERLADVWAELDALRAEREAVRTLIFYELDRLESRMYDLEDWRERAYGPRNP